MSDCCKELHDIKTQITETNKQITEVNKHVQDLKQQAQVSGERDICGILSVWSENNSPN